MHKQKLKNQELRETDLCLVLMMIKYMYTLNTDSGVFLFSYLSLCFIFCFLCIQIYKKIYIYIYVNICIYKYLSTVILMYYFSKIFCIKYVLVFLVKAINKCTLSSNNYY